MTEKIEHEMIELLWGITEKLDKILAALQLPREKSPFEEQQEETNQ